MSSELKTGPVNLPKIGDLYLKMTEPKQSSSDRNVSLPGVLEMIGDLSVTSQFKVSLHLTKGGSGLMGHLSNAGVIKNQYDALSYDFFCNDAALPGVSFNSVQEIGSHQGVIEYFPQQKIYPPFEITLYVDREFKIIRLFEEWINYINPVYNQVGVQRASESGMINYTRGSDFFRLRYPDDYKRIISITKFERNFRVKGSNKLRSVPSVTYRMLDAYPDQLNSIPVTYEGSTITKTTVRFLYTRYIMEVNKGYNNDV